jgi:hypothetical protein
VEALKMIANSNGKARASPVDLFVLIVVAIVLFAERGLAQGRWMARLTGEPAPTDNPIPGVDHVDRLNLGRLLVGGFAESEFWVHFRSVDDFGLAVRIERPDFVTVKALRVFRTGNARPGMMSCCAKISLETKR